MNYPGIFCEADVLILYLQCVIGNPFNRLKDQLKFLVIGKNTILILWFDCVFF